MKKAIMIDTLNGGHALFYTRDTGDTGEYYLSVEVESTNGAIEAETQLDEDTVNAILEVLSGWKW